MAASARPSRRTFRAQERRGRGRTRLPSHRSRAALECPGAADDGPRALLSETLRYSLRYFRREVHPNAALGAGNRPGDQGHFGIWACVRVPDRPPDAERRAAESRPLHDLAGGDRLLLAPGVAAPITLVQITTRWVSRPTVETPCPPPSHAPARSTNPTTSTSALRMTPLGSTESDAPQFPLRVETRSRSYSADTEDDPVTHDRSQGSAEMLLITRRMDAPPADF